MSVGAGNQSDANHANKRMVGNAVLSFSQCLLHLNILTDITIFLLIVFCFLQGFLCSYRSCFIFYQDFSLFIDLDVYLTEHLGKIDQRLQTGAPGSRLRHRSSFKHQTVVSPRSRSMPLLA